MHHCHHKSSTYAETVKYWPVRWNEGASFSLKTEGVKAIWLQNDYILQWFLLSRVQDCQAIGRRLPPCNPVLIQCTASDTARNALKQLCIELKVAAWRHLLKEIFAPEFALRGLSMIHFSLSVHMSLEWDSQLALDFCKIIRLSVLTAPCLMQCFSLKRRLVGIRSA